MILVDTSVWIDHLRSGLPGLIHLLETNQVVMHPLILGELACGNLSKRKQLLHLWQNLEMLQPVSHEEALFFIEKKKLMGMSVGFIDVQILASVVLEANTKLWTHDKRLAKAATELGYEYSE